MSNRQENTGRDDFLNYTEKAYAAFYDVIDDPYFLQKDQDSIYAALKEKVKVIPFGDHLKRYIYEKAEMDGRFQDIPASDYLEVICSEFSERQTPASFLPTTSRLKNLARNWLQQKTVNRNVVLLLGFGLGMSVDDVNDFLTKVIKEQRLNAKDPFEAICWYCYKNRCSYIRFQHLLHEYEEQKDGCRISVSDANVLENTFIFQKRLSSVTNDSQLLGYLLSLPAEHGPTAQSICARQQFDLLYKEVREWVADYMSEIEKSRLEVERMRLEEKLKRNDRYYDFEKQAMLREMERRYHPYRSSEITPADVEQIIFTSVPKDKHGNLFPLKFSTLFYQFSGSRLSRQHIGEILNGTGPITRYDLLTLNFFRFYKNLENNESKTERYCKFIESSNNILEKSDMGPVYPVNPYECFLMMCVLSEDPAGTFADVWELSYSKET